MQSTPKASSNPAFSYSTPYPNRPRLLINDVSPINIQKSERVKRNRVSNANDIQDKVSSALKSNTDTKNVHSIDSINVISKSNAEHHSSLVELNIASSEDEDDMVFNLKSKLKNNKAKKTSEQKCVPKAAPKREASKIPKLLTRKPGLINRAPVANDPVLPKEINVAEKNCLKVAVKKPTLQRKGKKKLKAENGNLETITDLSGDGKKLNESQSAQEECEPIGGYCKDLSNIRKSSIKNTTLVKTNKNVSFSDVNCVMYKEIDNVENLRKTTTKNNKKKATQKCKTRTKGKSNKDSSSDGIVVSNRKTIGEENVTSEVGNSKHIIEATVIINNNKQNVVSRCKRTIVKEINVSSEKVSDNNEQEIDKCCLKNVLEKKETENYVKEFKSDKTIVIENDMIDIPDCVLSNVKKSPSNQLDVKETIAESDGVTSLCDVVKSEKEPAVNNDAQINNKMDGGKNTNVLLSKEFEMPPAAVKSGRSTRSKRAKPASSNTDDATVSSSENAVLAQPNQDVESTSVVKTVYDQPNQIVESTSVVKTESTEVIIKQKVTRARPLRGKRNTVEEEPNPEVRLKRSKRTASKTTSENLEIDVFKMDECFVTVAKVEGLMNDDKMSSLDKHDNQKDNIEVDKTESKEPVELKETVESKETLESKEIVESKEADQVESNDVKKEEFQVQALKNENTSEEKDEQPIEISPPLPEKLKAQSSKEVETYPDKISINKNGKQNTNKRKVSDDNYVELQCRCNRKIQCFGPYSENCYSSKKMFGQGIEIMKCLKQDGSLMAGYIKIQQRSVIAGKSKNNTVYFVVEGSLRVDISGKVKIVKTEDCFMVVQDELYEIANTSKETARLSFVKVSRDCT